MYDLVPINCLPTGQIAEVGQLLGRTDQVQRLEELGLRVGQQIEMIRCGSPCILRVGTKQYGFRANDLLKILVKPALLA